MKIVIDLPKEYYEALKEMSDETLSIIDRAIIRYGTPLPEHHGRLIDADELLENASQVYDAVRHMWTPDFVVNADDIDSAPTIIEGSDSE